MRNLIFILLLIGISSILFATDMLPYLQTPSATSMYVCWLGASTDESTVQYGTTTALGSSATGDVHIFDTSTKWHFVKLQNLLPNTRYYYKCVTGTQVSAVNSFTTTPVPGTTDGHLRVIMMGDTRTNTTDVVNLVTAIQAKCLELYGEDWRQKINLLCHVGDTITSPTAISSFVDQFLTPFSPLSSSIPINVIAGNHEGENANFYNLMETTDVAGPEGKKYFSFDLANSKFIYLDSDAVSVTQLNWLVSKLTEADTNPNIDFVFGITHHYGHSEFQPLENSGWVQNSVIPDLAAISKPTMLSYGHAHCYERGTQPTTRTRLLLCGGGGAPLDHWTTNTSQQDYPEIHIALDYWLFTIVDIDLATHHYEAKTFSRGNASVPLNNVMIDSWSQGVSPVLYQANAISAKAADGGLVKLVSAPEMPYSSFDIMSSEMQVSVNSSFSPNLIDTSRNWEDIYRNTGSPSYTPIDVNAGIDLKRFKITNTSVQLGQTYFWRVRYRSQNADWGDWSSPQQFTYSTLPVDADFVYSATDVNSPIQFTDTSVGDPTAWLWDFDNDGTPESTIQDPVWTFSSPGTYPVSLTVTTDGVQYSTTKNILVAVHNSDQVSPTLVSNMHIYPNPTAGTSNITFELKKAGMTKLSVFNMRGELIKTLPSNMLSVGLNTATWDGKNSRGSKVSSGTYIIRISTENGTASKKMILMN